VGSRSTWPPWASSPAPVSELPEVAIESRLAPNVLAAVNRQKSADRADPAQEGRNGYAEAAPNGSPDSGPARDAGPSERLWEARAPPPPPPWQCRRGKANVGGQCWNCKRPRPDSSGDANADEPDHGCARVAEDGNGVPGVFALWRRVA
jgi:hypothetical protein